MQVARSLFGLADHATTQRSKQFVTFQCVPFNTATRAGTKVRQHRCRRTSTLTHRQRKAQLQPVSCFYKGTWLIIRIFSGDHLRCVSHHKSGLPWVMSTTGTCSLVQLPPVHEHHVAAASKHRHTLAEPHTSWALPPNCAIMAHTHSFNTSGACVWALIKKSMPWIQPPFPTGATATQHATLRWSVWPQSSLKGGDEGHKPGKPCQAGATCHHQTSHAHAMWALLMLPSRKKPPACQWQPQKVSGRLLM